MKWQPSEIDALTVFDFQQYIEFLNEDIQKENDAIDEMSN